MKLVYWPNPILVNVPADVTEPVAQQTIDDMAKVMKVKNGIGLSAVQVGLPFRFFVYKLDRELKVVVNPTFEAIDEDESAPEGCLSFPGIYLAIKRPSTIRAKYQDAHLNPVEVELQDLEARVYVHETDHCNGKTYLEHVGPQTKSKVRVKMLNMKAKGQLT